MVTAAASEARLLYHPQSDLGPRWGPSTLPFSNKRPSFQARVLLPDSSHTLPLCYSVPVQALDSHVLGTIPHQTPQVHMLLSGKHHETIQFYILNSPCLPLLLVYPWLHHHNSYVDWTTGIILDWSSTCHLVCLKQAATPPSSPSSSTAPEISGVLSEYHDYCQVFSKARPPLCPLIGSMTVPLISYLVHCPPKDAYTPCQPLRERPWRPTSMTPWPQASSVPPHRQLGQASSLWGKKIGLCDPSDYRGLNNITIKNHCPLPLISSTSGLLQGTTILTKLNLCSTYHLVSYLRGWWLEDSLNQPQRALGIPCNALWPYQRPYSLLGPRQWRASGHAKLICLCLPWWQPHLLQVQGRACPPELYVKAEKSEFHSFSVFPGVRCHTG